MDEKFLKEKGLFEDVKRFKRIMEYVSPNEPLAEADANADGLDDATGMADPMAGGAAPMGDPMAGGAAPAAPGAPQQGVPGFDPQTGADVPTTAPESFDEATPDAATPAEGGENEEVIDVDELVDGQKRNEEAIDKLTDKFEQFLEKFSEFQGELKSNAEFMANLESEFEKRNPTSVEKLSMRSLQSKPFQETPEEYMANEAPENYSPEDDNNGVGEPRYTITRDDVRNATDYASIAQTLRDNENGTLKALLGF